MSYKYPLNVSLAPPAIGFAVASNADEHQRLSAAGYLPEYTMPPVVYDRKALEHQAKDAGLKVDGRWSDARLAEELTKVQASPAD